MFVLYEDFYGIEAKYDALLACALELGNNKLHKELLTIPYDIRSEKIEHYSLIVQKIASKTGNKETLDILFCEGLLNGRSN